VKRIVVAITGASVAICGVRALQLLRDVPDVESHLVLTASAHRTIEHETNYKPDDVSRACRPPRQPARHRRIDRIGLVRPEGAAAKQDSNGHQATPLG
jgi:3-polyprenyl-4-hydroxybenzoate decarboxylase